LNKCNQLDTQLKTKQTLKEQAKRKIQFRLVKSLLIKIKKREKREKRETN
jgi:hypothetical protein